jgi:hypothetical protein
MAGLSLTTATSSSSGEYGGGGCQTNELFFFVDENTSIRLCLGFVGTGGRRFCLKSTKGGGTTCGVTKHGTKFVPTQGHVYLHSNDTTAFCKPCFPERLIPMELHDNFKTAAKTIEEWKQLFTDFLHDAETQPGQDSETTRFLFPDLDKFALKTPKKIPFFEEEFPVVTIPSELEDIRDQALQLAQEQYWWEEDDLNSLLPTPLFFFLKQLHRFLLKYDKWLTEPLEAIALRVATVEGDLHKLKRHCETLELAIGRPLALEGNAFPDVWSTLEFLTGGKATPEGVSPSCLKPLPLFRATYQSFMLSSRLTQVY